MASTAENLQALLSKIPREVKLVAVTKYATLEQMQEIFSAGHFLVGESKLQVAQQKKTFFTEQPIEWHLIGHLQSKKAKSAVELFELIHSVDSLKLANKLNNAAAEIDKRQKILLQVNIAKEPQKYGLEVANVSDVAEQIIKLPNIELCGLMAMAPYADNPEDSRPYFKQMKQLFDQLKQQLQLPSFQELSLGMSGDYLVAIEEGATIVRVGSVLFG